MIASNAIKYCKVYFELIGLKEDERAKYSYEKALSSLNKDFASTDQASEVYKEFQKLDTHHKNIITKENELQRLSKEIKPYLVSLNGKPIRFNYQPDIHVVGKVMELRLENDEVTFYPSDAPFY